MGKLHKLRVVRVNVIFIADDIIDLMFFDHKADLESQQNLRQ